MFKHKKFRVLLPSLIIVGWIVFAAIGGPLFGKISDLASTDLATFLPKSAESTKVNDQLRKFNDKKSIPILVVYSNDGKKLSTDDVTAITEMNKTLAKVEGVSGKISPPVQSDDKQAAFIAVPLSSDGDFKTIFPEIKSKLSHADLPVSFVLTGPASLAHELQGAFSIIDGALLFVALGVVFIILLCVYRSPFLPFIVLFTSMAALSAAVFVVYHMASAGIVQMNGQVQGIMFILVIGAATDYSLLYTARYREELVNHRSAWQASWAALKSSYEPVLAAGGTVTVGLLCLLFSDLGSNKALGPVGGIGIALSVTAALTLLPAILLVFGRTAFWPRRPKYAVEKENRGYAHNHPVWAKVGHFVRKHPRRIWVVCVIVLLACFTGIFQLKANGVSQSDVVLGHSDAREGQKVLDAHFPSGSGSPTLVIIDADKQDDAVKTLEGDKGVSSVSISVTDADLGTAPVGKAETELRQKIMKSVVESRNQQLAEVRAKIEKQMAGMPEQYIEAAYTAAIGNIPSAKTIADKAYPYKDAMPKIANGNVLYQVTLKDAATSSSAKDTVVNLRQELRKVDSGALVGGTTASQFDVNESSIRDEMVIIPLILAAITIILMLLLRAILAPLILLCTTILSFGATLGVSALVFNHLWKFPGADPTVMLFAFVFLVALGIDYNIFLMTRVREETKKSGIAHGTIKGLVVTGGVITSAGIVLASTFASLNVIPILFLAQIAFIVTFGVLLDTVIVRSLLVPALTLEVGPRMWWPSKLWRKLKNDSSHADHKH